MASPIYWLTHNPLTAYNLTLFLTWPLSAFAVYLLVVFLTRREDAAVLAGLAWAFTPYRLSELGHLQSLSAYWLPLMLLGLHGFLARRRLPWLVLFGAAWLCQSLANGYYMLFGAVLIGMWLAYFCSSRDGLAGAAGHSRHVGRVEPAARPDHVEVSRRARLLRAPPVSRRARRVQRRAALVGAGLELVLALGFGAS